MHWEGVLIVGISNFDGCQAGKILFEMQIRRIWEPSDTYWQRVICGRFNFKTCHTSKIIFSRWLLFYNLQELWDTLQELADTFLISLLNHDKEPFAAAGVNSNSCHCSGNISFEMQKSSGPGENLQPFLLLAVTVAFILSFTVKWPQKVERWDPNKVN